VKPLTLPERTDGFFVRIETIVSVAENKRCSVGAGELAGCRTDDGHDLFHVLRERKPLDDLDEMLDGSLGDSHDRSHLRTRVIQQRKESATQPFDW
jgi:hypothetical protein